MTVAGSRRERALELLRGIPDPEVPVLSIVELGIVRDVRELDSGIEIDITPTYSGCPAIDPIREQVVRALESAGLAPVRVNTVYAPAWTTDWIGEEAREKLRRYGIAPPGDGPEGAALGPRQDLEAVPCPFCGACDTRLQSEFGSTACKSLHFCNACHQPFEHFKCHR